MTDLVNAFMGVFDPVSFALITGGTIFGIIFGAIPGLTATLAVILMVPALIFSFFMQKNLVKGLTAGALK